MPARERYVEANGLRFHCYDWGGASRPVVLLHGLASNARIWDFVAPLLARRARVVAVDQRGHGLSDRPETGYGFEETVADAAGVIGALGFERPVVVGHSWGASVAAELAGRRPSVPAGIVMVDGGFLGLATERGTWEETWERMAPPRLAGTPRTRLLEGIRSGDLGAFWRPEFESIILAGFEVGADDSIAPRLSFERHSQIVRALWEADVRAHLGQITCPVLLLPAVRGSGEAVERKRAAVAVAQALIKQARVVWLEDSVHDVPLQRPELVAGAILGFLSELEAGPDRAPAAPGPSGDAPGS